MAGRAVMELLKSAFLTLLLVVLVSSEVSEDFHVSYEVGSRPSKQQIVIEYEALSSGRYRRQAAGVANETTVQPDTVTTVPPNTSNVTSTAKNPVTGANSTTPAPDTNTSTTTTTTTTVTTAAPDTASVTPNNKILEDSHQYYKSQIIPNMVDQHWEDLSQAKKHNTLSKSHRTAVTINLSFKFRFYGHNITNVTVATGGFLYASPFLHQWLTATQYIAPLMANFDLRIGDTSDIYYDDFGDRFAVQWRNVILKDQNNSGSFDFQAQLFEDGTIKFLYRQVPIRISKISNNNHPVKIGVSDAFYIDTYLKDQGIRRRTIYEYHRVSFYGDQVSSGTVIVMQPLPTCNQISDCKQCVNHKHVEFDCKWCGQVGRCSDGIDWHRSEWLNRGCKKLALNNETLCDLTTTTSTPTTTSSTSTTTTSVTTVTKCPWNSTEGLCRTPPPESHKRGTPAQGFPIGAIVAIILILLVVFGGIGVWLFYAYTHPTSASGMWLMEHRPSQMKSKIANIKFWKSSTPNGTKYQVESEA